MSETVKKALTFLNNQKTILYPTDTVWGLGCDATSEIAVSKIYQIKQREESKSLIILVNSFEMLEKFVSDIPDKAKKIVQETKKPTTIIYTNPIGLAENLISKTDNTVAIRIVQNDFCQKLIKQLGKPIVSTSANLSGEPTPMCFNEISSSILDAVDYVVNLQTDEIATKSSTILKIEGTEVVTIRE